MTIPPQYCFHFCLESFQFCPFELLQSTYAFAATYSMAEFSTSPKVLAWLLLLWTSRVSYFNLHSITTQFNSSIHTYISQERVATNSMEWFRCIQLCATIAYKKYTATSFLNSFTVSNLRFCSNRSTFLCTKVLTHALFCSTFYSIAITNPICTVFSHTALR